MKWDISEFVSKCLICQQVKAEHQVPSGLLQPVTIPEWKWEKITMDFVLGLPLSPKKKDVIWVIVNLLTKSAHFIPVQCWSPLFQKEILDLHPGSGISCEKHLVLNYISILHCITKLMDNLNVLYRFWKICFGVVCLNLKVTGKVSAFS
ncbi:integrase [Gossypium australe]|uniref:Integrase n=1 Tax=Gossypium australe TaxID=47621 RepID=A0A5B6VXH9_9ROSI|nr:integrase [Gossypium australe]